MTRIGHLCDIHHPEPDPSTLQIDLQHMTGLGLDYLVWGGDQIVGNEPEVPHSPASHLRSFWDDVGSYMGTDVYDRSYALAGNHDIPYTHHENIGAEYLARERVVTPMKVQPVSGVTILLINTQGPAIVQGGGDSVGQDYCRVPYHELEWLDAELAAAKRRGDIRIVTGHAPMWFGPHRDLASWNPDVGWNDPAYAYLEGTDYTGQIYEIPQNFELVRQVLQRHTPVAYFCGHDYHGPGAGNGSMETSSSIGGIYHTWQDHYSVGPSTFAYFDADPTTGTVTYKTVNSSDHPTKLGLSEQTILDISPAW